MYFQMQLQSPQVSGKKKQHYLDPIYFYLFYINMFYDKKKTFYYKVNIIKLNIILIIQHSTQRNQLI